jgi:hypothetical protein
VEELDQVASLIRATPEPSDGRAELLGTRAVEVEAVEVEPVETLVMAEQRHGRHEAKPGGGHQFGRLRVEFFG